MIQFKKGIVDISGHAIRQSDYDAQNPNRNGDND